MYCLNILAPNMSDNTVEHGLQQYIGHMETHMDLYMPSYHQLILSKLTEKYQPGSNDSSKRKYKINYQYIFDINVLSRGWKRESIIRTALEKKLRKYTSTNVIEHVEITFPTFSQFNWWEGWLKICSKYIISLVGEVHLKVIRSF